MRFYTALLVIAATLLVGVAPAQARLLVGLGEQSPKMFSAAVPITGLVVTKLDGTARGGVVVAVHQALDVPVKYLGVGESGEDLVQFEPSEFAQELLGEE